MIADAFRDPVGLCAMSDGTLLVAEIAAPKRFTRWSADGRLQREFHGPYYYSGMFGIDEQQPEYVYGDTHADLIRYLVDYETGRWNVDHYWIMPTRTRACRWRKTPTRRSSGGRGCRSAGRTWWSSGSGGVPRASGGSRPRRGGGLWRRHGKAAKRRLSAFFRPQAGRPDGHMVRRQRRRACKATSGT